MFIGLDLGTSGVRALLLRENGEVVASAESATLVSHPYPGWSEQDPADWITACRTALGELGKSNPADMAQLRGISLSGQMHGATMINDNCDVLRPCMLWNDTRSFDQASRLDAIPAFREISGNIVFPGFTAPKVLWVAENEPEIFCSNR